MAEKTSRSHMPVIPPGFIILRILQLLVATSLFGLAIWFMMHWSSIGGICSMAVSTVTIIILLWEIPAESCAPRAYNYWAVLTFEVILFVNYINALAWLILEAFQYGDADYSDCPDYNYYTDTHIDNSTCKAEQHRENTVRTMTYVGAGLCGTMFVFYLTSLIIVGSAITKHRNAGGHNSFGSQAPAQVAQLQLQPQPYNQYPVLVYTQPQPTYQQPPQMQLGQKESDYAALQQQYTQLQEQHAALQHQIQTGQTASPPGDYKGANVRMG